MSDRYAFVDESYIVAIRQDFAELGERGLHLVLSLVAGDAEIPPPVPPQLIVRQSTASPG